MGNIGRLGSEGGVRRKLVASLGRRVLVRGSLAGCCGLFGALVESPVLRRTATRSGIPGLEWSLLLCHFFFITVT